MNRLRTILNGAQATSDSQCCGNCDHFNNDPNFLERHFKGINILSSAYGSTRGDGGICKLHDQYLLPEHSCAEFKRKV